MKLHLTQSAQRSQRDEFKGACGERKIFSVVSASSNEVGVRLKAVFEFPQVFFIDQTGRFSQAGGWAET
jgi:hypothetical protein